MTEASGNQTPSTNPVQGQYPTAQQGFVQNGVPQNMQQGQPVSTTTMPVTTPMGAQTAVPPSMPQGPNGPVAPQVPTVSGAPQNPKQNKKKKPVYKRFWFWLLIVLAVIVIGMVGSSLGSHTSSTVSQSTGSSSSQSSKSDSSDSGPTTDSQPDSKSNSSASGDATGITYENWQKITLGADSGTTKEDVEKMFGKKADSTSSSTVMNVQTDLLTWNGLKDGGLTSGVTINFENNHAVMKGITGLKVDRGSKITLAQFQKIAKGQGKQDVESNVGKPDSITLTDLAGTKTETWMYLTGVDGDFASFEVTFTGDVVSSMSQSNMQ